MLFLHEFEHIAVAHAGAKQAQILRGAVFMQAHIGHHCGHKAAALKLALRGECSGADGHDLVTVDLLAVFIHSQAPVGIAIERKAKIVPTFSHARAELFKMRRAAMVVDVHAVRLAAHIVGLQRETVKEASCRDA